MKSAQLFRYAEPHEGVRCVEVDEPTPPQGRDLIIEIDASPIHPADLLSLAGHYSPRPEPPFTPGGEATGRVVATGPEVTGVSIGDRIIPLSRGNWVQRRKVSEDDVIKIPDGDPLQLAMLKVVPATAHLMLTRFVGLRPGDFCIQNAANSSVGMAVTRLARRSGVSSINVVRRSELVAELRADGAEHVFLDGPDLHERVRDALGDAAIRLAIDAVAGEACLRLSDCLSPGGTVINYGLLSGEPCMVRPSRVIFEDISLTGVWLSKYVLTTPKPELEVFYGELAPLILDGTVSAPIEATYPLEAVSEAVERAARFRRSGKIMLTPNWGRPAPPSDA